MTDKHPEPLKEPESAPGYGIAVAAEALYLINLMIAPGLAFVALLALWLKHRHGSPALARNHLAQTVAGSVWAGILLIGANVAIILLGGYDAPYTWVVVILYFVTCHATLIFFGAIGLARALSAQTYRYPLIGRPIDE